MPTWTFLFADLSGYTALTEAHGDADAAAVASRLHQLASRALRGEARIVKTIGDAVMIVSPTVHDAVATALALQRADRSEPRFPPLRCGLHAGTAVEQDQDFFGAAVNLAARVAAQAKAGEILCTEEIVQALPQESVAAEPMGSVSLKNVAVPRALFRIFSQEAMDIDPVCRMQVLEPGAVSIETRGRRYFFCSMECARAFREREGLSEGGPE